MRPPLIAVSAVLACIALSVACDNSGSTSPTVVRTTDTFTGTVQPMGADSHNFVATQGGEVDVTLTAAGPPPTILMGLGVGTPTGTNGACSFGSGVGISVNTQAGGPPIVGTVSGAGTFCFSVFDIGNQTAAVSYTVTVAHP